MRHRIYSNTIVVSYESYDWIVVTIFSRSQSFSGHSILCFCNGTWQHDNVWYGHHWILLSLVSISKSNWSLCAVRPRRETIMTSMWVPIHCVGHTRSCTCVTCDDYTIIYGCDHVCTWSKKSYFVGVWQLRTREDASRRWVTLLAGTMTGCHSVHNFQFEKLFE